MESRGELWAQCSNSPQEAAGFWKWGYGVGFLPSVFGGVTVREDEHVDARGPTGAMGVLGRAALGLSSAFVCFSPFTWRFDSGDLRILKRRPCASRGCVVWMFEGRTL